MIHLYPSNQHFILDQLRSSAPDRAAKLTENEQATLEFCHAWLNGVDAFTVNTSGSTGTPKPIQVTRHQMETSALATAAAVGLQPGMRTLVCLPTRFIAGKMMLVRGLVVGMEMTVIEPSSNPLAELPADSHFDFTAMTPMQMMTIFGEMGRWGDGGMGLPLISSSPHLPILNSMHAILLGGGAVSSALEEQLQLISAPIYHTYGMTETVSHVALRRLNGAERSEDFRPLPGVILGMDERGCLNIRAPMTNEQVLQTNDIVDLHADSSFRWLGRWDNVINSGGVKVQVEQVEQEIEREMGRWRGGEMKGRRFFVTGVSDETLGEKVALVVEGLPLSAEVEGQILNSLRNSLTRYEVPRAIVYAEHFSETPTGKIDRRATMGGLKRET